MGGPVKSITVTNDASNNPLLYAIGSDGNVYGHKLDASGNSVGNFFFVKTSSVPGGPQSIYAGVGPNNTPELFEWR